MADEETEFEEVEEGPAAVEVLPPEPPPRQWNWIKLAGVGLGFVLAWHAINRVDERFGTPAPAAAQQAAVVSYPQEQRQPPEPPRAVIHMIDEFVHAETPPARSEAWTPQIRLGKPLWSPPQQERPRDHVQEAPDLGLERAIHEHQVLSNWGSPPCPPQYHHKAEDPAMSCWPDQNQQQSSLQCPDGLEYRKGACFPKYCWKTRVHLWCPPQKPGCIYDYNVCTGEQR